jgi:hypothetical protein
MLSLSGPRTALACAAMQHSDVTAEDSQESDQPAEPDDAAPAAGRGRRTGVWALLILGGLLAVLSVTSIFVRNILLDTDRYVDTVAPLADDPAIQEAAATRVTDAIMSSIDVTETARNLLPPRAAIIAPALEQAVRELVARAAGEFFASDAFETLWDEANRSAHTQIGALLTGDGTYVSTDDGRVAVDLAAVAGQIRVRLAERGLTIFERVPIDRIAVDLQLFESDALASAQGGVDLLQRLAWFLPVLMLAAFAAAVLLSRDRLRALWRVGIALAVAMAVLMIAIALGRRFYLDALPAEANRDTARAAFDILTRFLRQGIRFVFGLGALLALGAWLAGASPSATRVRALFTNSTDRAGSRLAAAGEGPGGFATWVAAHRRGLQVAVLVVLGLLAMSIDNPGLGTLVLAVLVGVVLWAAIAVVARAGDGEPMLSP